jgi:hypothetical protein
MLGGGALVAGLRWAARPRTCAPATRADALLGGGLPICLGQSTAQLATYGDRVRHADSADDRSFASGELRYTYLVRGDRGRLVGRGEGLVHGACVEVSPTYPLPVDSLAAFRRTALGGDWVRADAVETGITATTWRRADGLRLTTSPSGVFCALPALTSP